MKFTGLFVMANKNLIEVFYDGKCGMCRREINHYRHIAPENTFDFIDITQNPGSLKRHGVTVMQGLKLLHVRDAYGSMRIGLDAFIVIWRALPRWRLLGLLVSVPGIKQVLSYVYRLFAAWRFKHNGYHCSL